MRFYKDERNRFISLFGGYLFGNLCIFVAVFGFLQHKGVLIGIGLYMLITLICASVLFVLYIRIWTDSRKRIFFFMNGMFALIIVLSIVLWKVSVTALNISVTIILFLWDH